VEEEVTLVAVAGEVDEDSLLLCSKDEDDVALEEVSVSTEIRNLGLYTILLLDELKAGLS